jgi:phosphoserine phosphatase RsbU/P
MLRTVAISVRSNDLLTYPGRNQILEDQITKAQLRVKMQAQIRDQLKESIKERDRRLTPNDLRELLRRFSQEQIKIQELLGFLGFALRSFNNLNQFLELIPLVASRVTDTDGGALILFKNSGARLESIHCPVEGRNGISCKQVKLAIEQAIQISLSGSQGMLDEIVSRHLGADVHLFGTSILVKSSVRGRLYVFSRAPNYAWSETRQKLMRLVADQTAVGIENNALAAELLKKERQDRELEIGAEIQRQLLPRNNPNIPGLDIAARCHTANRVGGDYYDFIPVSKSNRWGIVIGDVMGKGVPAGLIMTMTRGMLRAEVLNGHPPGTILAHLNEAMYEDLEKSHRFLTMFYSEYDPLSQILHFSNAAHLPLLLWRSQKVQTLDTLGALIGLEPDSQFEEGQIKLQAGDVLLYYTDGITEAVNQMGERFDEDNLRLSLQTACQNQFNAQEILDYLFEQVQTFMGRRGHQDDMTLVVLRVS